jgi:hypothetical protein
MPVTISGTAGITYPAGGLANTVGAGVGTSDTQTLTNKTLTTPNIDSAQFATVSGTAPIYPCRAWVNFNGTGTVAIRASGNVTSITDNGTGDYTVNFTTAMPDANYSALVSCAFLTSEPRLGAAIIYSTSSVRIKTGFGFFTTQDVDSINVSSFR